MRDRRLSRAAIVMGIVLGLPVAAFAAGPCGCSDIKLVEDTLATTRTKLDMWKKVDAEAQKKTFPTASWAKKRYLQLWKETFPGVNPVVVGQQTPGEKDIFVSPELKAANCDGIWKAVEAHELDHARFDKTIPNHKAGWVIVLGQEGAQIARKEVEGHTAEVKYLERELENLKKACQTTSQRYQEQDETARALALARVQRAGARVAAYAATIR